MAENRTIRIYSEDDHELPQVSIRMVKERTLLSEEAMNTPEAAIRVMQDFLKEMDREMVCVVNLQNDLKPISMNVVSMGALNQSLVHPREIMKSAILSNAASFMLIHNHPSGSLQPSAEDIRITDRMQQVGELLGIPLTDHIITGLDQQYYSFHEKRIVEFEPIRYSSDLNKIHLGTRVAEGATDREYDTTSIPTSNDRVRESSSDENQSFTKTTALPVQGKDLSSIMQSLEMGVQDFLDGDQARYQEFLRVMTKFHSYSLNNTLLIAMQRPDATLCNSYKRWQSLGRQVKRGEKGITIIAPAPVKAKKMRERKDQDQKPIIGADGHPEMEEVETVIPRFKATTVFAYEQTEGEPLPLLEVSELSASVENFDIFMEAIKRISPVPIRFDEISGGAKGYYSNATKEIVLNQGMSESQTMKTAIHECAHAWLHDKEIMLANGVEKDRMTKEIEAESCAFCVCAAFNLDTSDYSFPYISGWSKEHDMKELKGSLDIIRKTSGELIDQLTNEMQAVMQERTRSEEQVMDSVQSPVEASISFYVAECIEFPVMGEYHEGLTLEQAMEAYEKIPSDRIHGVKGIGFDLQDGSIYSGQYELFAGGKVCHEALDLVDHYKNSPLVQDAVKRLDTFSEKKQEKQADVSKDNLMKQEQAAGKPHKKREAMSL